MTFISQIWRAPGHRTRRRDDSLTWEKICKPSHPCFKLEVGHVHWSRKRVKLLGFLKTKEIRKQSWNDT